MAFKPTPILHARLEARLRGWRGPATNIIRAEEKKTDPLALSPAFIHVSHTDTQRALPVSKAHKMMGLPMSDILDMRGGTRRDVEVDDIITVERIPRFGDPELQELESGIAKLYQKTKPAFPYRARYNPTAALASKRVTRNPIHNYKPPPTMYSRHSVYTYNKHTQKALPMLTANANKLLRAYFNMCPTSPSNPSSPSERSARLPHARAAPAVNEWGRVTFRAKHAALLKRKFGADDLRKARSALVLEQERINRAALKRHKTATDRMYVSDRGYPNKGFLRQDLLGKISRRMQPKTAFHYPYRVLGAACPQITYKHWRNGVGITVHVHEGEEDEPAGGSPGQGGQRGRDGEKGQQRQPVRQAN